MICRIALTLFSLNLTLQCILAEDPIVDTTQGKIQGRIATTRPDPQTDFYAFEGIPYAKPPIGDLRFKAPQPLEPWGYTPRPCQSPGQRCSQFDGAQNSTNGGEDCLFLNIYTRSLSPDSLQPVMFWVHGGAYIIGSGSDGTAPDFFIDKSVILVTINYRLDVFGFLSLLDENAYGNAGLKDEIAALSWVKDNIVNFGGDPDRITIIGESAGSNAVALLHLSPRTAGLFSQIISESSSALSQRHFQKDPLPFVYNLGKYFGINTNSTKSIAYGLREISTEDLLWAANQNNITGYVQDFGPFPFSPVVEPESAEAVITKPPYQILKDGEFNRVPYIFGHNSNEGTFGIALFLGYGLSVEDYDTKYELFASKSFQNNNSAAVIGKIVRDHYLGNASVADLEKFATYLHQELYARANRKEIDFLRQYSEGYYYKFSYKGTYTTSLSGVGHGEELQYIFYDDGHADSLNDDDRATSRRMVQMWTNFAKTGNPTPEDDAVLDNIIWSKVTTDAVNFLEIGKDLVPGTDPDQDEYIFWEDMFNAFGVEPYQTY